MKTTDQTATISECQTYRYDLRRVWDADLRPCLFVMLNPSTADATEDDPTIRRVVGFAERIGAGGVVVVNLFAYRATDPAALAGASDPVGPENDSYIRRHAERCHPVVAAWGSSVASSRRPALRDRPYEVLRLLGGVRVNCFGRTKGGHPRHPLYLPAAAELVGFAVACSEPVTPR